MTIQELLRKIAQTDALPSEWRIQQQQSWHLKGAAEPEHRSAVTLEYRSDDLAEPDWHRFGDVEISQPLRYTNDWIDRIVVNLDVPAAVLLPLQDALGSQGHILELFGTSRELAAMPA